MLPPTDVGGRRRPARDIDTVAPRAVALDAPRRARRQTVPDLGVLALVGGDRRDLGRAALGVVGLLLVALERLHEVRDRSGPEQAGHEHDEADAGSGTVGRWDRRAE